MVADTAALIESLGAAPARNHRVYKGEFKYADHKVSRPEQVTAAVLMATRGRLDTARQFFQDAEAELYASGIQLPPAYDARNRLLESFSRKTINDDAAVADWIAMFSTWPTKQTPGLRCQLEVSPQTNRLPSYRSIAAPVLVLGFSDDIVTPPYLGREVADAMPNGRFLQIPDAGHLGFLERPQAVNNAILQFFKS
jgi:pimeloyl-ACP methyl ester carboxylesterase